MRLFVPGFCSPVRKANVRIVRHAGRHVSRETSRLLVSELVEHFDEGFDAFGTKYRWWYLGLVWHIVLFVCCFVLVSYAVERESMEWPSEDSVE